MKTLLPIKCRKCKKINDVLISPNDTGFEWVCSCGEDLSGSLSNNVTIGIRLLFRSYHEFNKNSDYPLSIVFSAIALECELSRLFFKWRKIDSMRVKVSESELDLEKALRNFKTVDVKFEEIAKLMYPKGLTAFVQAIPELRETITTGFQSLKIECLSKDFQKKLFWPRNRILHLGAINYDRVDAQKCYNISRLGIRILHALDAHRRDEQKHRRVAENRVR